MSKKSILILVVLIILIVMICAYFFLNRTIQLNSNANFKKVYNSAQDIANIEITVIDATGKEVSTIINKEDISTIIDTIKDEMISDNINLGEASLGKAYRFIIKNKIYNSSVKINISTSQLSINNKNYSTKNNLLKPLTDVYLKYDTNPLR